jgi:lipopolysaccharide/colanic/teichoic acid biosynthesis glycosyltransferase
VPISLVVALAVWVTSPGPILFLQERIGREGTTFTILKFRTMCHRVEAARSAVATNSSEQFTWIGLFLRRWKLDELPQLLNVLLGDMSLVGARPKVPEHHCGVLRSRPGITGAATLAFARGQNISSHCSARAPIQTASYWSCFACTEFPSRSVNDFFD